MGIRNCKDIGENLKNIVLRFLENDRLVNLLYYTDTNPLAQTPLTASEKAEKIFDKLIKITPYIGPKETAQSLICIRVLNSHVTSNSEFKNVIIEVESYVPLTQVKLVGDNLRPFAIMGEVQESILEKPVNGLGTIQGGSFTFEFSTDEVVCYSQLFELYSYD